jgi:hypothetical protein
MACARAGRIIVQVKVFDKPSRPVPILNYWDKRGGTMEENSVGGNRR